ncbi:indolepyruvate ferredoxin oxidoreductase family protein [Myxococcota bacterium]|nr:indolepyruvate ferredoxin oxidoreductase family protein [Myxococcota bacterium]
MEPSQTDGPTSPPNFDAHYELNDRYRLQSGRVFLTGTQALTRLPMMQRQRDLAAGLNTAGFISGYRGSPLGNYDMALWQAQDFLEQNEIVFKSGINEDMAATAVWGSQQTRVLGNPRFDGVFGIWYGKGPGVDRSGDALKHGNYAGSGPNGGVLVLCGDDPGAKSSSVAHQSEQAMVHMGIPVLNPSNVQEYLDLGLYGFALSRYSGCWVAFKCLTDTVESSASVSVDPDRIQIVEPDDYEMPEGGLNLGAGGFNPAQAEQRVYEERLPAVQAFVRANGLDRVVVDSSQRRLGIVTTGKAYLDVRQALDELGIDEQRAESLGLSIYKVALTWPLEPINALRFAEGLDEIIVVEEKRPLIEEQLAAILYNQQSRPKLYGKRDGNGNVLLSSTGELSPAAVGKALRSWLSHAAPGQVEPEPVASLPVVQAQGPNAGLVRMASFCSGCPHNSSTVVPEGSAAMGGIGCHGMVVWHPKRNTIAITHMGGEGATWIGASPFIDRTHIFQNMGDGTYFHSGLLAIRAAVAADANMTYKVLVNGAVAMTGGQPIEGESMDGEITTPEIAHQLRAEGIDRIAILSNDIEKYSEGSFPTGTTIHHRDEIDRVQREIREVRGVTAIVYDQTCAAEARRLRKRGEFDDPDRRIVINEAVCEGCGDCSVQSNCIAVEPVETEFGRKRKINQSGCNKDFSCTKGYCPSFASIYGGQLRKAEVKGTDSGDDTLFAQLPEPLVADTREPFNALVVGIGGTGVVTVGALLGMAAHLEGKGCSLLDLTGLSQKNGPVFSHIRIADEGDTIHATRIGLGSADLVLGCDIVSTSGAEGLPKMKDGRTTAIVNTHLSPTADFTVAPDLDLSTLAMQDSIRGAAGQESSHFIEATRLATALMGDAIASNLFLLGYAMQLGRIPVHRASLERAIELNGRSIEMNKRAIQWGRLAAVDFEAVERAAKPGMRESETREAAKSLEDVVALRVAALVDYQDEDYAKRYTDLVDRVKARETEALGNPGALTDAVARYHFKLLAYKDEYEVARMWSSETFRNQLDAEFEGDYRMRIHLAPQLFWPRDPDTGRVKKITAWPWVLSTFSVLAKFKGLRGTAFDPFGYTAHRKLERQLITDYEKNIDELLESLAPDNVELAASIASIPEHIRGFDLVKEQQLEDARSKEAELLAAFRLRSPAENELPAS